MATLIDTSVLFAYTSRKDARYAEARRLIHSLIDDTRVVSAPVLNELFYLATVRINYRHATELFATVQRAFQIEALITEDMRRMEAIMLKYASSKFDFTDTAIMAQAERLEITRVATFDRRDFPMFRPAHYESLELLP